MRAALELLANEHADLFFLLGVRAAPFPAGPLPARYSTNAAVSATISQSDANAAAATAKDRGR
jgi:hypothetical protein